MLLHEAHGAEGKPWANRACSSNIPNAHGRPHLPTKKTNKLMPATNVQNRCAQLHGEPKLQEAKLPLSDS
eukprot:5163112-Amphidinium_carterae.1